MPGLVPIDITTIDAATMTAAIAAAERAGDMSPVWTLIADLLARTPGLPRDQALAVVLFTLAMDAAESDDTATKRACLQTMREHCSRKAIDHAVVAGLLGKAGRQGWLAAAAYDELATRIDRLPGNHPARALFVLIERRRDGAAET